MGVTKQEENMRHLPLQILVHAPHYVAGVSRDAIHAREIISRPDPQLLEDPIAELLSTEPQALHILRY